MRGSPRRTCIGCRQVRSKAELIRLVRGQDGRARADWRGSEPGRGVYVCPTVECAVRGLSARRLGHALRAATEPPANVDGILKRWREGRCGGTLEGS